MKVYFKWKAVAENSERHFKKCPVTFYNFFFFQFTLPPAVDKSTFLTTHLLALPTLIFDNLFSFARWQILSHCVDCTSLITSEIEFFFYIFIVYIWLFLSILFLWCLPFFYENVHLFYWLRKVLCILNILAFSYICYKHFHLPFIYLYLKSFCIVYNGICLILKLNFCCFLFLIYGTRRIFLRIACRILFFLSH